MGAPAKVPEKVRRPEGEPQHGSYSEASHPAPARRPRLERKPEPEPEDPQEEIDSGDKSEGDTPLY